LVRAAEAYSSPAIEFLKDLVRIRSVNGQDSESFAARRVLEEARNLGLAGELSGVEEGRLNVLVHLGDGPRGFALIGHLDTVSAGDNSLWRCLPFSAEVVGGRLYGRGSADNKAGIACGLYTLALLRDLELFDPHEHRALLAGVVDEESGASSPLGVRYLLDAGLLPVRAAIYTYASDVICIGHRGLLRLEIRAEGAAVHSGSGEWDRGEAGVNAATGLSDCLVELEKLEIGGIAPPAFHGLSNKVTPGTLLRGGDWPGMVPAWSEAVVDIRLLPGVKAGDVLVRVDEVIAEVCRKRPGLAVQARTLISLPGAAIPADHPLVTIAGRATEEITGEAWPAVGAGPANEGYMLIEAGIPTLCGFGPRGGNAHAPDEWVSLESIPLTIAMYTRIILEYLEKED
jgi:acetylornithine deacetylase/succinyl-diaminopimelate desuccinylase-like protein